MSELHLLFKSGTIVALTGVASAEPATLAGRVTGVDITWLDQRPLLDPLYLDWDQVVMVMLDRGGDEETS